LQNSRKILKAFSPCPGWRCPGRTAGPGRARRSSGCAGGKSRCRVPWPGPSWAPSSSGARRPDTPLMHTRRPMSKPHRPAEVCHAAPKVLRLPGVERRLEMALHVICEDVEKLLVSTLMESKSSFIEFSRSLNYGQN